MKIFIATSSPGRLASLVGVAEELGFEAFGLGMGNPCDFPKESHEGIFGEAVGVARDFAPDFAALDHFVFGANFTGRDFVERLRDVDLGRRVGLDPFVDQSAYCGAVTLDSSENSESLYQRFGSLSKTFGFFPRNNELPVRFRWVFRVLTSAKVAS